MLRTPDRFKVQQIVRIHLHQTSPVKIQRDEVNSQLICFHKQNMEIPGLQILGFICLGFLFGIVFWMVLFTPVIARSHTFWFLPLLIWHISIKQLVLRVITITGILAYVLYLLSNYTFDYKNIHQQKNHSGLTNVLFFATHLTHISLRISTTFPRTKPSFKPRKKITW